MGAPKGPKPNQLPKVKQNDARLNSGRSSASSAKQLYVSKSRYMPGKFVVLDLLRAACLVIYPRPSTRYMPGSLYILDLLHATCLVGLYILDLLHATCLVGLYILDLLHATCLVGLYILDLLHATCLVGLYILDLLHATCLASLYPRPSTCYMPGKSVDLRPTKYNRDNS